MKVIGLTGSIGSGKSTVSNYLRRKNYEVIDSDLIAFDVVKKGEKSYFNLCKNINFKNLNYLSSELFTIYEILENDTWPGISYKVYNTIDLWWLICKFNNVKNPFKELTVGKILRIPSEELVDIILETIKNN